jgi:hypothetical protein
LLLQLYVLIVVGGGCGYGSYGGRVFFLVKKGKMVAEVVFALVVVLAVVVIVEIVVMVVLAW